MTDIEKFNQTIADLESGKLEIDLSCEDIHMFVESELTKRIGDAVALKEEAQKKVATGEIKENEVDAYIAKKLGASQIDTTTNNRIYLIKVFILS